MDLPGLASLLSSDTDADFSRARGARVFEFPLDYGPHPGYRNEWWYLTGNLQSRSGRRFGYELTLFRFSLVPPDAPTAASAWSARDVFVGHFTVTDVSAGRFHVSERWSRGAAGLAGADTGARKVWLYDWTIRRRTSPSAAETGSTWQLQAKDGDLMLALSLTALKPPVLHGDRGLSQKSAREGNASWYYSLPRLRTSGRLHVDGQSHDVEGLSWIDREWSSSALGANQEGWDWFSLQLGDGSDLMFYQLRNSDGRPDLHSAGTFMPASGDAAHLVADAVSIEVLDYWDSPAGGRYPIEWRLVVPGQQLNLHIRPVLKTQELSTWVRYWEGAVDVSGIRGAEQISGRGYVEMTGYAQDTARARAAIP
jgi:predicted secreted hydrolase